MEAASATSPEVALAQDITKLRRPTCKRASSKGWAWMGGAWKDVVTTGDGRRVVGGGIDKGRTHMMWKSAGLTTTVRGTRRTGASVSLLAMCCVTCCTVFFASHQCVMSRARHCSHCALLWRKTCNLPLKDNIHNLTWLHDPTSADCCLELLCGQNNRRPEQQVGQ